jgi:C_GCAxxG_C_C family probable redox protein
MPDDASRQPILQRVQQRGGDYVESVRGNCAQSILYALSEDFPGVRSVPLHALTAMSGIALRGETCGAVSGALLAIGVLSSREGAEFLEAMPVTMPRAARFCDAFQAELGSLVCRQIHVPLFGRAYDLSDAAQQQEFLEAGGLAMCRRPVETAARIVAELMLEDLGQASPGP